MSSENPKSKKRKRLIGAILAVVVVFLLYNLFFNSESVFHYVFSAGNSLKQTDGRVNILLLGYGGGNHDGAYLTDSIIVSSINLKTHNVVLFSIPRDLWLPGISQKVNAAYETGLAQNNGLGFAEDKIDDILGITIHYGVSLDFNGFSTAIDDVGGVDVNVPDTFDDYQYPIDGKENDLCGLTEAQTNVTADQAIALGVSPGIQKVLVDSTGKVATESADFACRYEHIHFDQGLQHMDGTTALKFVRSRHAEGPEGSDFARSGRQQLVIQAFRNKLFSAQTLLNPSKISSLINTLGSSFQTDIPPGQYLDFYNLAKNVKQTKSVVLGDLGGGKSLFINPPPADYGGGWVLVPPNNDFSSVAAFVKQIISDQDNPPNPSLKK